MRVLITGASGQLGMDLVKILSPQFQVYGYSKQELDVINLPSVLKAVYAVMPDCIIHCAAYTKVDQAEKEKDTAYLVNSNGTRNVSIAAAQVKSKLIYISTDYVFNGQMASPYTEWDEPDPLNVYGKSKLAGEKIVKEFTDKYFIVRTSWLYGWHGPNFVKTMLKLSDERKELFVVDDQIGSPTFTVDLAHFLKELVNSEKYGIYHATNSGFCSWYEFALAIFEDTGKNVKVNPIKTKDFPRLANRPAFSILKHSAIQKNGFTDLRAWREALIDYLGTFHKN
jgi:dTDP-4-dehydrorhamnose reductase